VELLRLIREEEPPRPSTRLSESRDTLPSVSAQRNMEPAQLTRLMRGELDWIVMKALEKDRNRRYETATGLAWDVQRYLEDEPVQACPPSAGYRLRKFVRRHRGPVLASAVVLLALVGGMVGTTWGLVRAEQAWQAEANRAEAERQAKETTQAVLDFVENRVFKAARQEVRGGLGREVTLRRAVEAALPFVEKGFPQQPLIEARLRRTLGVSFGDLGEAQIAAEQFQRARTLYSQHLGPDHPDTLASMMSLANSYHDLGRHAEALKLNEETLTRRTAKLGPDHPDTLSSMLNLAYSYDVLGRYAEAIKLNEETLRLLTAKLGADHPHTLMSMGNLASIYHTLGRNAEELKLSKKIVKLRTAKLGPDDPETLSSMHHLAECYAGLGRHAEALKLCEETLKVQTDKLGPDHPETLWGMNLLAACYRNLGQHAEALKFKKERLRLLTTSLGGDHPDTLRCMDGVAYFYIHFGRHVEALKVLEEVLRRWTDRFGPDNPNTLLAMNNVACVLATAPDAKLRDPTRALRLAKAVVQHMPKNGACWGTLGAARYRAGDWNQAIEALEKSESLSPGQFVDSNGFFLAMAHWQLGEKDKAREWYAKALDWMEKHNPKDEVLKRLRAEATALLDLAKAADSQNKKK
jgi:tetratricopeptide (TPR) repeat protein